MESRASQFESTLKETIRVRDELREALERIESDVEYWKQESFRYEAALAAIASEDKGISGFRARQVMKGPNEKPIANPPKP